VVMGKKTIQGIKEMIIPRLGYGIFVIFSNSLFRLVILYCFSLLKRYAIMRRAMNR